MEIYVEAILAAKPKPFALVVELSDQSFGLAKIPLEVGVRWHLEDKSGNLTRYATWAYVKKAFYALSASASLSSEIVYG